MRVLWGGWGGRSFGGGVSGGERRRGCVGRWRRLCPDVPPDGWSSKEPGVLLALRAPCMRGTEGRIRDRVGEGGAIAASAAAGCGGWGGCLAECIR